jgi:TatD DNase family protein
VFINIHTHNESFDAKIEIVSLAPGDPSKPMMYSRGIHPWKINKAYKQELEILKENAQQRYCIGIGECGLDKYSDVDFELQKAVFEEHIKIANELNKPLIVHCVKSHSDLIGMLKKANNKVPVIVHGFNNNLNTATSLLKAGIILSFGKALLNYESNAVEALRNAGREKFFLETDDQDISIKYIYKKAAEILFIDEEILQEQLKTNFRKVFKEEIL